MSTDGLPRFTETEMTRRAGAARDIATRHGLDALLIFGHSGSRRHYQADIHYLTEVAPYHEAYLLLPVAGEPVFWITHNNHYASARELSRVSDVRRSTRQSAATLIKELKARGFEKARIGLVGPFFYQELDEIRHALPDVTWSDVSGDYKMMRVRKSEEELQYQRIAAAGCDAVIEAMRREVRPGVEERDLLVLSEEIAWKSGCQPNFLYLNSTPMADPQSCVPNQNLSRRKLCMGDVINTELTVSYAMYSAQILRPFFLGEPTLAYAKLYEVLKRVHDRLEKAMNPGVTMADLHPLTLEFRNEGYTTVDGVMHGFGVDILPPGMGPHFAPPTQQALETGITIVLQPNPTSHDEKMGMQLGEMGLITPQGFRSMHASASEVIRCG
jgi:Xaa-Pro aminopeptidase